MPRISVVIPTHGHAALLPLAVASCQAQLTDDCEIVIIGDGAGEETLAAANALAAGDRRIRYLDFSKGAGHGEAHRDGVLREIESEFIFYNSDDDLWLPCHLRVMMEALEAHDFVGAMHVNIEPEGTPRGYLFDLEDERFRKPWLAFRPNGFGSWANDGMGLSFVAHRRDAYLRLPQGWTERCEGYPSDQTMWHKFGRDPACRMKSVHWPVALHFSDKPRRAWEIARRAAELAHWYRYIAEPGAQERLVRAILDDLAKRLVDEATIRCQRDDEDLSQS